MLLEKKYISRRLSELAVCLSGGRLTGVFVYLFIYLFNNLTVSWPADTVRVPPSCRPRCAAGWKQSRVRPTSSSTAILFEPLMWKSHIRGVFMGIHANSITRIWEASISCLACLATLRTPNFYHFKIKRCDDKVEISDLTNLFVHLVALATSQLVIFSTAMLTTHTNTHFFPNYITASIKWQLP